jgi:hypothetical protein
VEDMTVSFFNQAAHEIMTLIERMTSQYNSHFVAMLVARDPRAASLAPPVENGEMVPLFRLPDGAIAHFHHFLSECRNTETQKGFDSVWLVGALLTVDDKIKEKGYFGHAPEAEMVRHLRNGVAHGNKFKFNPNVINPATRKLKHPATTARYAAELGRPVRQVDVDLEGKEVMFGWGGPDAVIDCLEALRFHLSNVRMGP